MILFGLFTNWNSHLGNQGMCVFRDNYARKKETGKEKKRERKKTEIHGEKETGKESKKERKLFLSIKQSPFFL